MLEAHKFGFLGLSLLATSAAHATTTCDVKAFHAHGDGVTKDTVAIQAAIDSCASQGGGIVDLHEGTFLSGTIRLRSGITLRIEPSATLKGTRDDADYPTQNPLAADGQPLQNSQLLNCRKSLIYAERVQNIAIDGGGTIDGNGGNPNWTGGCSGHSCKEATRPMPIFIVGAANVTIENIQVKDGAMWDVVNMETDNLTIRGVTIHSPFGPTRDGIDIVDCHHVLVENCNVYSEDDAFCLKSGSAKGVYDVTIRNSTVQRSIVANALKLGTASTGSFKKVLFQNITIQGADKAAMAVESVDGAAIDDIRFENIRFHNTGTAAFVLLGKRGNPPEVGSIQNVTFTDVTGDTMHTWGSAISGTIVDGKTYSPKNIVFDNVHVVNPGGARTVPNDPPEYAGQYPDPNLWGDLPASGYFIRHVAGFDFRGSSVATKNPDARPTTVQRDTTGPSP